MQTGPVGFDAALAAGTAPTVTVEADVWGSTRDLAPMTSKVQVTRELAGDLPTLASSVSGSVATKASVDVDGFMVGAPNPLTEVDRIDWTSAPVRVAAGFAGLTVPVFAGTIREMSISELTREIALSCLDGADQLRAPLTLPQWGLSRPPDRPASTVSRPTNLSAVVVAALHANGIRITPTPRVGCLLSVPSVGGYLAEVGRTLPIKASILTLAYGPTPLSEWIPGPFGPALETHDDFDPYIAALEKFAWVTGAGIAVEGMWKPRSYYAAVDVGLFEVSASTAAGHQVYWEPVFSHTSGQLYLNFHDATTTVLASVAATYAWHHVAVQVRSTGYWALWLDGVVVASGTSSLWADGDGQQVACRFRGYIPSQAVQIHGYPPAVPFDAPTAAVGFAPQADVDQSVTDLQYVPIVEDRISWEVLKEVAAAEAGTVGFDESGRFHFRSSKTLNAASPSVATISTDVVANLVGGTALTSVVSSVSAKVRPHGYIFGSLDSAGIWQTPCALTSVPMFQPGTTQLLFTAPRPVIIPEGPVTIYPEATSAPQYLLDYAHTIVLCTASDGTSGQLTSAGGALPAGSIAQISPTTLILTVTNPLAVPVYAIIPTAWDTMTHPWPLKGGAPSLLLSGWSTPADPDIPTIPITATNDAAADLYGARTWTLPDSQWRQDQTGTQSLAAALLADLSAPRLLLENVQTQWDPRWQLGDVVTVTDSAGRMPTQLARITAIDPTLALTEERRMTVKLGLRLIPPPPVTVAQYDAWWAGSTAAHHDAQWAAARPGGVNAAQADALPLRVSP